MVRHPIALRLTMMRTRCAVILLAAAFHCSTLPEPAIAGERPEIFVQMGHTGNVTCAVFTPDGKYLLSGSVDKTMKLWDVATGKELRTFSGPTDRIAAIAVSPDGKYAVSGDEDFVDNLKLWELSSGKQVKTFGGHVGTEGTTCVVFCPDGKHILSGGDSTVKLWDIASGKELRTMYGNGYRIRAIAISPDGRTVVAGSRNNSVTMVDSLNADGTLYESRQVYEKSAGNTILVWDVASGRLLRGFNHARGWVHALAMTPNGAYVISGDFEDSARMWEVA
jgi:WD40 repeat protein